MKAKAKKSAPSVEESMREMQKKLPTLAHALMFDWNGPGSNFYDAQPCEYTATFVGGVKDPTDTNLCWKARSPFARIKIVPFAFRRLEEIPGALLKLAVGLKLAFTVPLPKIQQAKERFSLVFVPKGDRRAAHLAGKPERAHELDGLPYGTALLFDTHEQECNGLLVAYRTESGDLRCTDLGDGKTSFGVSVWGRFYAIQIARPGFSRDPLIKIE